MLSGPETGKRERVTRKADGKLTLLMNLGGVLARKADPFGWLPISAYPFELTHFRATELQWPVKDVNFEAAAQSASHTHYARSRTGRRGALSRRRRRRARRLRGGRRDWAVGQLAGVSRPRGGGPARRRPRGAGRRGRSVRGAGAIIVPMIIALS